MSDSDSKGSSGRESDEEGKRSDGDKAKAVKLPVKELKKLSKKEILQKQAFYVMEGAEETDDENMTPTQKISFEGKEDRNRTKPSQINICFHYR